MSFNSPTGNGNGNVLAAKDSNVPMTTTTTSASMAQDDQKQKDLEYHRQVLKSKMEAQQYVVVLHRSSKDLGTDAGELPCANRSGNNYISPSDEIMSPCTAKLNALRNKQVGKYVSLLQASALDLVALPRY